MPPRRAPARAASPRRNAENAQRPKKRPPHPGEAERIAARRLRVLTLRIEGHSYRAIALKVKVDPGTVCRDLAAERAENELLRVEAREADRVKREAERDLDLQRIDRAIRGLMKGVDKGVAKSVTALMRSLDRRAKLLGLDAPVKLSGPNGGPVLERVQMYLPDNGRRRRDQGPGTGAEGAGAGQ